MAEPSLTELASAGQSVEAIPTIAVNNQQEMVRTLNQQAQFKAQNDWNKYLNFQKNLGDFYSNVAEVEKLEVMDEDRAELQKDTTELLKMALENPGAFSGRNPEIFGKLQSMYGGVLSKATESKQNNLFDKANRQYIAQNNELNTDENKAIIDQNKAKPLGSRSTYSLNMPTLFDAEALSKGLMESPQVKQSFAKSEVTPDEKFIKETTGTKYDRNAFLSGWSNALNAKDDKYGHSVKKWAEDRFKQLPADVHTKIGSVEKFWDKLGEMSFASGKDIEQITKEDLQANANYLKKDKLDLDKLELNEKIRHDKAIEGLGWEKLKFDNADDDEQAKGVIIEIDRAIADATRPENLKFVVDPNGNRQQYGTMSDPELLKKYANIDKDGKTTNAPDDELIDRTSGQILLAYYKRDDNDEIVKDKQGAKVIERSVPINTSTWVSSVVGRNESTKNKGKVNNNVQKFYDNLGGIYKGARQINQAREKQDAAQQSANAPVKAITDYSPKEQEGIQAVMQKNKISEADAIQALIQAGRLK